MPRRCLALVDSLLDLDENSREADSIRRRRAELAKYTKAAVAGALVICVAAGARMTAGALVGEDDSKPTASAAADGIGSTPKSGKGVELLATAPQGAKLVSGVAVAKFRSRSR